MSVHAINESYKHKIEIPYGIRLAFELKQKFNIDEPDLNTLINNIHNNPNSKKIMDYIQQDINNHLFLCKDCHLCKEEHHSQKVPGVGPLNSPLVLIGEGPGFDEDKAGKPFVGRAGQLLTTILNKLNVSREKVYITNIVKCRPPNNRQPLADETNKCSKNLELELMFIMPKVIITLGSTPLNYFKPNSRITKSRGKWIFKDNKLIMPTFHPAYILRQKGKNLVKIKWEVWHDFNKAVDKAKELCPEYNFKLHT